MIEAHRTTCRTLMGRLSLDVEAHAIRSFRLDIDLASGSMVEILV